MICSDHSVSHFSTADSHPDFVVTFPASTGKTVRKITVKARSRILPLLFCLVFPSEGSGLSYPGCEWKRLSDEKAASAGWSRDRLGAAREYAATLDTEAVMIVVGGRILDEWGPVDRKFNVHSIRKSFLSAMCGIQVEAGRIDLAATMQELGIDDNAPALTEVEKQASVHDLLKARSGVYHPALYETAGMKARRPERHSHGPGAFFYYNNWDFNALGTIYEEVAGSGIYEDFGRLIAASSQWFERNRLSQLHRIQPRARRRNRDHDQ